MAVDTLGRLLSAHVTPATTDDRRAVERLAAGVQAATGESVDLAYADQGHTGEKPARDAAKHGIELEAVRLAEAKPATSSLASSSPKPQPGGSIEPGP